MSFYLPKYKRKPTNRTFKRPSTFARFKITNKTLPSGKKSIRPKCIFESGHTIKFNFLLPQYAKKQASFYAYYSVEIHDASNKKIKQRRTRNYCIMKKHSFSVFSQPAFTSYSCVQLLHYVQFYVREQDLSVATHPNRGAAAARSIHPFPCPSLITDIDYLRVRIILTLQNRPKAPDMRDLFRIIITDTPTHM